MNRQAKETKDPAFIQSAGDNVRAKNYFNTELIITRARWFVIVFLALYLNIMKPVDWPMGLFNVLLGIASVYNLAIGRYLKRTGHFSVKLTHFFLFCDMAAVGVGLYFTGGVQSPLFFIWYLTLFTSGFRLGYWKSLTIQIPMALFFIYLLRHDENLVGQEFLNRLILGLFSIGAAAVYGAFFSREEQFTVDHLNSYHRESITDRLTGLFNYSFFMDQLSREHYRAVRAKSQYAVAIFDLDHFKQVNDTHGHAAGNVLLKGVADILKANARKMDVVARFGGEEFAVLMPESKGAEMEAAERIRKKIEATEFGGIAAGPVRITISGGVCSYPTDADSANELLEKADKALYLAKSGGRNRTNYCGISEGEASGDRLRGDRKRRETTEHPILE